MLLLKHTCLTIFLHFFALVVTYRLAARKFYTEKSTLTGLKLNFLFEHILHIFFKMHPHPHPPPHLIA
ncbi:hypothetical protein HanXRQr2_Chr11g0515061 [Helianthus annuus]|uniref:Uncharacterized protein n=1 Tax=Helianthus annuus TaxID=4232 RepID=A0A9K3HTF7_HELAN|nr:hypothetical protein HanXRQr2_Chr11g0515061 [Helianthus annuus]